MDLRIFGATFAAIFLAELGDKTQLAVLTLVASTREPLSVFVGAVAALAIVTLLGVLIGEGVASLVPAWMLRKAAALVFLGVGVALLLGKVGT